MKIIKERQFHEEIYYYLSFVYKEDNNSGFSFPCDYTGKINQEELSEVAQENLRKCRNGEKFRFVGFNNKVEELEINPTPTIEVRPHSWVEPPIGLCDCGEEVDLAHFTNTCHNCYRDYNYSGQELGLREYWGEETGESLGDILRIK